MRIAQVAPPWLSIGSQDSGETENVVYHLVEEMVALGHDVTLFAPADASTSARQIAFIPQSLLTEGVPWQANLKAYYHLHKSFEYIAGHDFDIVHSHLASSADMYIYPLSSMLQVPHVTTLHSHFPFDRTANNWVGDADNYFMEWASHVPLISSSNSTRKHIKHPAYFTGTVHPGIHVQEYHTRSDVPGEYLLWLGSFTYEQGAHLAIETARRSQQQLILAGVKESHNREAAHYYQHMIAPYIDGKRIQYRGAVNTKDKLELLSRARALLRPVQWDEPFSLVILEAMALGCPVINFARGAAGEIIEHERTGFIATSTDEMVSYSKRIDDIARSEVRKVVQQRFSARTMAKNYLNMYKKVIADKTFKGSEEVYIETGPLPEVAGGKRRDILSA